MSMGARRAILALTLLAGLLCPACGGGDATSKPAPIPPALYDMQPVGPTLHGIQVGSLFSVALNFFQPGTTTPYNQPATESISVSLEMGPGVLSGTTTLVGDGSPMLVFNNLSVDLVGVYQLRFSGPAATSAVSTIAFEAGPKMELRFAAWPSLALKDRAFDVTVQTVAAGTLTPIVPNYPVSVTVERDPGSGTATLTGTTTADITTGTVTFTGLTYPSAETIALRASAAWFAPVTSATFTVDSMQLSFSVVPASVLVNGTFSLSADISGVITGQPIAPNPPLNATIGVASGPGALSGPVSAVSSGAGVVFNNLSYNQTGGATFIANSSEATSAVTSTINFGLSLQVTATGPTVVAPTSNFSPFQFRAVDGTGAAWTGAISPLAWTLTNSVGTPVQSGNAGFAVGVASVTPAPILQSGNYLLSGGITVPIVAGANIGISVSALTLINQPGPFVALKSCRVGTPYSDSVSFAAPSGTIGYGQLSGYLPTGLVLNATNGAITGTPTVAGSYAFTVYASLPGAQAQAIRCALAVFSTTETEVVAGQNFKIPGPYAAIGPVLETFSFTSSYDALNYPSTTPTTPPTAPCRVEYYYPNFAVAPSPAPVFVHHRGRGFNMVDYHALGQHLASYGFIYVSVEDYQSFLDNGGAGMPDAFGNPTQTALPSSVYDISAAERGMLSASAFQEAVLDWVISRNSQLGHGLYNRMDVERVFAGGHSRGGGATQATHVRSKPYIFNGTQRQNVNFRGVVYFMAFDLRYFGTTISGTAQVYPIPTAQPRLPCLAIAAEKDGDLFYPICDQFIDRATGPTTFATIYGGCHAYLSDAGTYDAANASITRLQQQQRMFQLVVAFLRRWSSLDLSVDGMLYKNELAGSPEVGMTALRNMMEMTIIDSHQDASPSFNSLGGSNSMAAGSFSNAGNVYPALGYLFTTDIRHNILTLNPGATAVYTTTIPAAFQNQSRARRLVFRCGTIDITPEALKGFDWVTIRVRLTSGAGATSTITLFDRQAGGGGYLPDYQGGPNVYDRFVDASIPLGAFVGRNPAFNQSQISNVELIFETDIGTTRQFYFDDIRFE